MKWTVKYDVEGQACGCEAETEKVFAEVRWDERWLSKGDHAPWEWSVSTGDLMQAKFGRATSMESGQKSCEEAASCLG